MNGIDFDGLDVFQPVDSLSKVGNASLALHHHAAPARNPWDPEEEMDEE
ncbi:MAG: hypothetical protein KDB14_29695 [Planctomycetales bacterium]|nr:hypothetical protein [Planctomycetales bacterium]